jgi:hypothetical protein
MQFRVTSLHHHAFLASTIASLAFVQFEVVGQQHQAGVRATITNVVVVAQQQHQ